jgi:ATPase subunit of ABC transporter with duplicated ATPase domains
MPEMPTASSPGDGERTAAATFALELRQISKRFGLIEANRAVDLRISPGEIRGLVGENGAGKSTLMAIASGLPRPPTPPPRARSWSTALFASSRAATTPSPSGSTWSISTSC